jgi:type I restriction enzyme R subunit
MMHDTMKKLLPDAMFLGFTGTPLLKSDKYTSFERFGSFIHTYKYDEAVKDAGQDGSTGGHTAGK